MIYVTLSENLYLRIQVQDQLIEFVVRQVFQHLLQWNTILIKLLATVIVIQCVMENLFNR